MFSRDVGFWTRNKVLYRLNCAFFPVILWECYLGYLVLNKQRSAVWPFDLLRMTSVQLLQTISPLNQHKGHEIKGNDHQRKKLLIGKQILLISALGM